MILRAPKTLQPRRWVRRWMVFGVVYVVELFGHLGRSFAFARDDANRFADQYDWRKSR